MCWFLNFDSSLLSVSPGTFKCRPELSATRESVSALNPYPPEFTLSPLSPLQTQADTG